MLRHAFVLALVIAANPPARSILFIGNSLTAENDLATVVCRMAVAGGKELECAAETSPGFDLSDQWRRGEARRALSSRKWEAVVLQQGPSSLPKSREMLVAWSQRWAKEIRGRGGKPALLTVWPAGPRSADFDRVIGSYAIAASESGGMLIPAGAAWRAAWKSDPTLPFYGGDGFHPSPAGTWLAALTVYRALYGEIPERFAQPEMARELGGVGPEVTAEQLRIMRESALAVFAP